MQNNQNEHLTPKQSITSIQIREIDISKPVPVSTTEFTPKTYSKTLQKYQSTKIVLDPVLLMKYSSIQITPKSSNPQYVHFNLEDLTVSPKQSASQKRIQYCSTISAFQGDLATKSIFPKGNSNNNKPNHKSNIKEAKKLSYNHLSNSQNKTNFNTINMRYITLHEIRNNVSNSSNKEKSKDNKHNKHNVVVSPGKTKKELNNNNNETNTNKSNPNNSNSSSCRNYQPNLPKRNKKIVCIHIDVDSLINSSCVKCEKSKSTNNIQKQISQTEGNNNKGGIQEYTIKENVNKKKENFFENSKNQNKKIKFSNTTTIPFQASIPNQQTTTNSNKKNSSNNLIHMPKQTNHKHPNYYTNRKYACTHQNCLTVTNTNSHHFLNHNGMLLNNSINDNQKHSNCSTVTNNKNATSNSKTHIVNKQSKLSFSSSMQTNTFKQKMKIKGNRKDISNESKDILNPKTNFHSKITGISINKNTFVNTYNTITQGNIELNNNNFNNNKFCLTTINLPLAWGMSTKEVVQRYHKYLTIFELHELLELKTSVYYLGEIELRKQNQDPTFVNLNESFVYINPKSSPESPIQNRNHSFSYSNTSSMKLSINPIFDDKDGNYIIKKGYHINYRYELLSYLGRGSYGQAIKCYDHKTNEFVCIKIIKSYDKFSYQATVEINLLEYIKLHDTNAEINCVNVLSHFTFRNHICLVFELLDMNLYEYLKLNDYNGLNIKQIRLYTIEILFVLLFMRQHKIIHCDLKPENILLLKNKKNSIKVIDFGSSCFDSKKVYFYIQSRFYRAPEIILELEYSMEIDIWSLGCILCELYTGQPIFPGEDERDQLNYMIEYLDVPPQEYINSSIKKRMFFDVNNNPLEIPNSRGHIVLPNSRSINSILKGSGPNFIDFITNCLKWNPNERITPEEALLHKFIVSDMNYETLYQHKLKINRIKLGIQKNMSKNANSNLNSNRSPNNSLNNQNIMNLNEGRRNISNNIIDKKKISVSIDKKFNDKNQVQRVDEHNINGIPQSRSVDKKKWSFKGRPSAKNKEKTKYIGKHKKDVKYINKTSKYKQNNNSETEDHNNGINTATKLKTYIKH